MAEPHADGLYGSATAELRALATRILVHRLEVTDPELAAFTYELAAGGYPSGAEKKLLQPDVCLEVAQHLLRECRKEQCPLDLRLLEQSYGIYRQWQDGRSVCPWYARVSRLVRQVVTGIKCEIDARTPEEKKADRRRIVRTILVETDDADERVRLYEERTGCKRSDFFVRKREVESGEFDPEEAE